MQGGPTVSYRLVWLENQNGKMPMCDQAELKFMFVKGDPSLTGAIALKLEQARNTLGPSTGSN